MVSQDACSRFLLIAFLPIIVISLRFSLSILAVFLALACLLLLTSMISRFMRAGLRFMRLIKLLLVSLRFLLGLCFMLRVVIRLFITGVCCLKIHFDLFELHPSILKCMSMQKDLRKHQITFPSCQHPSYLDFL